MRKAPREPLARGAPDTGDRWVLQALQQARSGQHADMSGLLHPCGTATALDRFPPCMTARDSTCMAAAAPEAAQTRTLTVRCCDADVQGSHHAAIQARRLYRRQLAITDVD